MLFRSDRIEKVIISNRLVDSPSALSTSAFGWSARMEQIMKIQTLRDNSMHSFMESKKILELNPNHFVVQHLQKIFSQESTSLSVETRVWILYDTALLTSGFGLKDPNSFSRRVYQIIGETIQKEEEPSPS